MDDDVGVALLVSVGLDEMVAASERPDGPLCLTDVDGLDTEKAMQRLKLRHGRLVDVESGRNQRVDDLVKFL